MINCINIDNNIIDLNGIKDENFIKNIIISSKKTDDTPLLFFIDIVSSENINAYKNSSDEISLGINVPKILKEEYVILKNSDGERVKINILPNPYFLIEKTYKFKITKKYIDENGDIKLKILSKVNDEEIGWKCTYMGQPISYQINPLSSDKSCYVTIKLLSEIHVQDSYYVPFKFRQDDSNNEIKLKVTYTQDDVILEC